MAEGTLFSLMTRRINVRLACLLLVVCASAAASGGWDTRFALAGTDGDISSLVEFQGNLYAVGGFSHIAGIEAPGVARWDGVTWTAIYPEPTNAVVGAAVVTPDAMYFAFYWTNPTEESTGGLLRWDGQNWQVVRTPTGYRGLGGPFISAGTAIIAELFPVAVAQGLNARRALAKWDGNGWEILALTSYIGGSSLNGLVIAHGDLYASGGIPISGTADILNVGRLAGSAFEAVGGGLGSGYTVSGIASDGENLFVYGSFISANSQPAEGLPSGTALNGLSRRPAAAMA